MKIKAVVNGSVLTIFLCGELGHHEAIDVISRIRDEMERGAYMQTILDMDGLTFMDSSGIAVVMKAYKIAQSMETKFAVKVGSGHKKRILMAAGLNKIIDFI